MQFLDPAENGVNMNESLSSDLLRNRSGQNRCGFGKLLGLYLEGDGYKEEWELVLLAKDSNAYEITFFYVDVIKFVVAVRLTRENYTSWGLQSKGFKNYAIQILILYQFLFSFISVNQIVNLIYFF